MTDNKQNGEGNQNITSTELSYILEVNNKAITLYTEIGHQNEQILEKLNKIDTLVHTIEGHMNKLLIFLGVLGAGVIFQVVKLLFGK